MRLRDLLLSAVAIVVLVTLIVLADDRVRERIVGMTPRAVSHHLVDGAAQAQGTASTLREIAMQNGPLAFVVIAGTVLFICMLRT